MRRVSPPSAPAPGGAEFDEVLATPALVEQLPLEALLPLLDRCAVGHDQLTTVERLARARLRRELPTLLRANEPLLTADEAARRLRVSADYVRDHGDALGIAAPLHGVTRYNPAAVDALRRQRQRDA
jgi:hypothetical protein